ncbi:MAG TPA: hypothetical protein VG105_17305 [Paraburkholderia sp.]|jgi:hypothetical protein|nr:hypothetical protein [Paraburkholderia sp.]
MKLSTCVALAALTLSATAYAQTSQTYHFGEGQSAPQGGNAQSKPKAKKHKPTHHKHRAQHVSNQDMYSHS